MVRGRKRVQRRQLDVAIAAPIAKLIRSLPTPLAPTLASRQDKRSHFWREIQKKGHTGGIARLRGDSKNCVAIPSEPHCNGTTRQLRQVPPTAIEEHDEIVKGGVLRSQHANNSPGCWSVPQPIWT
jgi:hypothetical protein